MEKKNHQVKIIFYPQLKIVMDFLFFVFASLACLMLGMIGFMFASLFIIYIILFLIPKTKDIGRKLLELSALVVSFFFFKFMIIGLFFPWGIWLYIKTYINVCKNVINPQNTFKENFKVLIQDYYDYIDFVGRFAQNMKKVDFENKDYEEVPKENK